MFNSLFLPFSSYKYLLYQLIQREIKARYKQSVLGYAWVIINPLLQLVVYSFVFSMVFRFPTNDIPYAVLDRRPIVYDKKFYFSRTNPCCSKVMPIIT